MRVLFLLNFKQISNVFSKSLLLINISLPKLYNFLNTEQKKIHDDHKNKNLEYFFFRNTISSEYTFIIGKKSFKKLLVKSNYALQTKKKFMNFVNHFVIMA